MDTSEVKGELRALVARREAAARDLVSLAEDADGLVSETEEAIEDLRSEERGEAEDEEIDDAVDHTLAIAELEELIGDIEALRDEVLCAREELS